MKVKYLNEKYFNDVTMKKNKSSKEDVMKNIAKIAEIEENRKKVKDFLRTPFHDENGELYSAKTFLAMFIDNLKYDLSDAFRYKGYTKHMLNTKQLANLPDKRIVNLVPMSPCVLVYGNPGDDHLEVNMYFIFDWTWYPIYSTSNEGQLFFKSLYDNDLQYLKSSNKSLLEILDEKIKFFEEKWKSQSDYILNYHYFEKNPKDPIKPYYMNCLIFCHYLYDWIKNNKLSLDDKIHTNYSEYADFMVDLALTKKEKESLIDDIKLLKEEVKKKYDVPIHINYIVLCPKVHDFVKTITRKFLSTYVHLESYIETTKQVIIAEA